jgi:hypothetical protein
LKRKLQRPWKRITAQLKYVSAKKTKAALLFSISFAQSASCNICCLIFLRKSERKIFNKLRSLFRNANSC